ncbi:MAG: carboxypeptidase-like regulatory domain-containing protein [Planctomycetota bacterium]
MKSSGLVPQVAVCLAVVGLCIPQLALAAAPQATHGPVMNDLQLREGGVLIGQVVTPENVPAAGIHVSLRSGGRELNVAKTDKNGYFAFRGLKSGVYQLVTAEGQAGYRVWAKAPPGAQSLALVVNGIDTVRGQHGMRTFRNLMANPWVIAGLIAVAVAVPVAIHNAKSTSP